MTCLVDCCHSGTILDLPFTFKLDGSQKQMTFDPNFRFPHTKKGKEWNWAVYVAAAIPVVIAIAIPILLCLLPWGAPESEPEPEPVKQGPLRMIGKLFQKRNATESL